MNESVVPEKAETLRLSRARHCIPAFAAMTMAGGRKRKGRGSIRRQVIGRLRFTPRTLAPTRALSANAVALPSCGAAPRDFADFRRLQAFWIRLADQLEFPALGRRLEDCPYCREVGEQAPAAAVEPDESRTVCAVAQSDGACFRFDVP